MKQYSQNTFFKVIDLTQIMSREIVRSRLDERWQTRVDVTMNWWNGSYH